MQQGMQVPAADCRAERRMAVRRMTSEPSVRRPDKQNLSAAAAPTPRVSLRGKLVSSELTA